MSSALINIQNHRISTWVILLIFIFGDRIFGAELTLASSNKCDYQIVIPRENATPELLRVIELSELGFGHYLAQKFEQAIGCYQQILEIKKDDHISLFYIERCRSFLVFPPSSDWDGVHISNSK